MKLAEWFKSKIGKKIIASHEKEGDGVLHVKDEKHAEYLYKTQRASNYSYLDHDDSDSTLSAITTGILVGEMLSNNDTVITVPDTGSDFGGFGGGQTGGGGSGGSWDGGSSSDSSSSFDSGSSSDFSGGGDFS